MDFQIALQSYITAPSSPAADLQADVLDTFKSASPNVYETLVAIKDDVAGQSLSTLIENNFNGTLEQLKTYLNSQPAAEKITLTSDNEDAITEDFILKLSDRGFIYNSVSEDSTNPGSPVGSEWSIGWDFTKSTVDDRDWLTFLELIEESSNGVKVKSLTDTLNLLLKLELVMRVEVGSVIGKQVEAPAAASRKFLGGYYYYKFQITDIEFSDGSSKSQSEGKVTVENAVSTMESAIPTITSISYNRLMIDPVGEQIWSIAGEYYSYLTALPTIADKTTAYEFGKYDYDHKTDLSTSVSGNLSELSEKFGKDNTIALNAGFDSVLEDGIVATFELNSNGDTYEYVIDSYDALIESDNLYNSLIDAKKDINEQSKKAYESLKKREDAVAKLVDSNLGISEKSDYISRLNSDIASFESQIQELDENSETYADDLALLQERLNISQAKIVKAQLELNELSESKAKLEESLSGMKTEEEINSEIQSLVVSSLLGIGIIIPQVALSDAKDALRFLQSLTSYFELDLVDNILIANDGKIIESLVISDSVKGIQISMNYEGDILFTFGKETVSKLYSLFIEKNPSNMSKNWMGSFASFLQYTDEFLLWIAKADKFESQYNFISSSYDTLVGVDPVFGSYKKELGDSVLTYAKLVNLGSRENYSLVELAKESDQIKNVFDKEKVAMKQLSSVATVKASKAESTLIIVDSFEDTPMWFTKVSKYFITKINNLLENAPIVLDVDSIKNAAKVIETYVDNRYEFLIDDIVQNIKDNKSNQVALLFDNLVGNWVGTDSFLSTDDYSRNDLVNALSSYPGESKLTVQIGDLSVTEGGMNISISLFDGPGLSGAFDAWTNLIYYADFHYGQLENWVINNHGMSVLEYVRRTNEDGSARVITDYTYGQYNESTKYQSLVDVIILSLGLYTTDETSGNLICSIPEEYASFRDDFNEFYVKSTSEYLTKVTGDKFNQIMNGADRYISWVDQASIFRLFGVELFHPSSESVALMPKFYQTVKDAKEAFLEIYDILYPGGLDDIELISRIFDSSDNVPSGMKGFGIIGFLELYGTLKANYPSNNGNKAAWDALNETLQNLSKDLEDSKVDGDPGMLRKGYYALEISGQWYLLYMTGKRKPIPSQPVALGSPMHEYLSGIMYFYSIISEEEMPV